MKNENIAVNTAVEKGIASGASNCGQCPIPSNMVSYEGR
jgi:hypothetical protein